MRAETVNINWREEQARLKQEMVTQHEKLKEVMQQNEVLLNKIQELSLNMAVTQCQVSCFFYFFSFYHTYVSFHLIER